VPVTGRGSRMRTGSLVRSRYPDGHPRFPRQAWFTELIHSAKVSRNIVAHMNPLQPTDVTDLERSVRKWFKQIKGDEPPAIP
jgi:hypothetical protein